MVSAKELTPQALQGHIIVDLDLSKGTASTWAPQFIQPVLQQVVLAGKSMEMLQALARLGNIIDDDLKGMLSYSTLSSLVQPPLAHPWL